MPDETQQPVPEPTSPETQNSESNSVPVSPQEPIPDTSTPPIDSASPEMSPEAPRATPSLESAVPVNNDISANEPFDEAQSKPSESAPEPLEQPNITVEKHGNDVTITEVMEPKPEQKPETAQMAGNEPFDTPRQSSEQATQDKPIDLTEEIKIKQRQENLKLANETRQEKKRKKIDAILDLFAKQTNLSNDEVEKLLHVSDATATRYLETLEKEGRIKQVGKTGKGVKYEKI